MATAKKRKNVKKKTPRKTSKGRNARKPSIPRGTGKGRKGKPVAKKRSARSTAKVPAIPARVWPGLPPGYFDRAR